MKRYLALGAAVPTAFVLASGAWAHSSINPPVAKAKTLQPFTLELQAEKENARTTRVEVTFPEGFNVETFPARPGWKRTAVTEGDGEEGRVLRVVWTGGEPTPRDDPVFQFTGTLDGAKTYGVEVRQSYSDGSVDNWEGPEGSEEPAAFVEGVSSLGGGETGIVPWVALVLGGLGLVFGVVALVSRGGREIA